MRVRELRFRSSFDIETALKAGLINAESVITHHGAKNKLLKSAELNKILKKKRIKVKVY